MVLHLQAQGLGEGDKHPPTLPQWRIVIVTDSDKVIFPLVLSHCWLGVRKGIQPVKTGCWFVDGDILTGALHIL